MTYKRTRRQSLTERIKYWGIKNGVVITREKAIETGVIFSLPSAAEVTESDREILSETLRKIIIQSIPQGCRGRLIVECTPIPENEMSRVDINQVVENDLLREMTKIASENDEKRRQLGELSSWRYFFTIKLDNKQKKIGQPIPFVRSELDPLVTRAEQLRTQLLNMLNAGGFTARPMSGQELFELIWRYFNPTTAASRAPLFKSNLNIPNVTIEQLKKDFAIMTNSMREQITESEIDTSRVDALVVGQRLVQTINMLGKPDTTFPSMPENLLKRLAGKQFYYVLDMVHLDQSTESKALNSAARSAATATVDTSLGAPDVSNNARLDALNRVIYRMRSEGEHIFDFGVSMVLIARSVSELEIMRETARTEMSMMGGMRAANGTVQNIPQYLDRLAPLNGQNNEFMSKAFACNVADFIPLTGPWAGSRNPVAVFSSRYGTLTGLNPADGTDNYGTLIVGSAGSGKTFFTQGWITRTAGLGADVIIVDQKRDYESLISALEGQFIPFAPGETFRGVPIRFNAFELPKGEALPDDDHKMFLRAFITALVGGDELSSMDMSIITAAIDEVYAANVSTNSKGEMIQTKEVTLGMFVRQINNLNNVGDVSLKNNETGTEAVKRLTMIFQQYLAGTAMGNFFDGPSTININSPYVYFDISKIAEQDVMRRVALLLIVKLIWARAKANPERPKVAVIEEIGVLFNIPEALNFVASLYKLGRAYNLWPVGVTQEISDFQKGKGLINNTSQFIIGKVSAEEAGKVVEVLGLNAAAHEMILSLGGEKGVYREFLAMSNKESGMTGDVIRYFPNLVEYWMYTSAPEEKARRVKLVNAYGGNVLQAVKTLAGVIQ